jgi:hypothetical protein
VEYTFKTVVELVPPNPADELNHFWLCCFARDWKGKTGGDG